jgi:hypothetical protein
MMRRAQWRSKGRARGGGSGYVVAERNDLRVDPIKQFFTSAQLAQSDCSKLFRFSSEAKRCPCGGVLPSSPSANANVSLHALKTCAGSPPQYEWIFKGACQKFGLTSIGGHFSLGEYQGITLTGLIGKNTARGMVKLALADAIDQNGDIETYKGKAAAVTQLSKSTFLSNPPP